MEVLRFNQSECEADRLDSVPVGVALHNEYWGCARVNCLPTSNALLLD